MSSASGCAVRGRRTKWGGKLSDLIRTGAEDGAADDKAKKRPTKGSSSSKSSKSSGDEVTFRPEIFRDNNATVGGGVKEKREVVSTRPSQGNQPNVNCRVDAFGRIVAQFDTRKRKWVKDMGFGPLLWLAGKGLPRHLCYWLMTKVDPIRRCFVYAKGKEFPLNYKQVREVLGLPYGPKKVPDDASKNTKRMECIAKFVKRHGVVSGSVGLVPREPFLQMLEEENLEEGSEIDFKVAFLYICLADVLCPTTSPRLGSDLMPAPSVAMDAANYDWSSLVLKKLIGSARNFASRFYRDSFAQGCGGCMFFLAVLYFDRLDRPPTSWDVVSRIKAWSKLDINKAQKDDRFGKGGDLGKLGLLDLAYGEEHPFKGRDVLLEDGFDSSDADETAVRHESVQLKGRRRGPSDATKSKCRRMAKKRRTGSGKCEVESEGDHFVQGNHEVCDDCAKDVGMDAFMGSVVDEAEFHASRGHADGSVRAENPDKYVITYSVEEEDFDIHLQPPTNGKHEDDMCENEGGSSGDGFENMSLEGHELLSLINNAPILQETDKAIGNNSECYKWGMVGHAVGGESGSIPSNIPGGILDENHESECGEEASPTREEVMSGNVPETWKQKSRCKRRTNPAPMLTRGEYICQLFPRQSPQTKAKLISFVIKHGAALHFPKSHDESIALLDPVMLKCEGMDATVRNCFTVVDSRCYGVDDNDVRVAASLYTKKWKSKYQNNSVRAMIDPLFAISVGQYIGDASESKDYMRFCKVYAKSYAGVPAVRLAAVYYFVFMAIFCLSIFTHVKIGRVYLLMFTGA